MNKLFNFAQTKGKWHKFPSFNLGGGAKLYKNFAQKLLAVSLCMAMVLLGTPVTTFADPHAHTTEYSGTKGDDDYCLVCDVATKVNNLYGDSVGEITVENAAKVISQIHAIDQIKFELDDAQYEELIKLTDGWSGGEYGELPSKYFKAKEKIDELGLTGGWLDVDKTVLGVDGDWALDLSKAKVSLEVTPVEAADDGTYVATSAAETINLDMYGMYDNFSMVLNETTTDFRGRRSFYKRYDVNAGFIDNVNNNGWTTSFLLPEGTYRICEVNREAPMIVDDEEFHTGSTTYTYNGASTTSVVGEDDPGVVVQVAAGAVTPVALDNMAQGSLTVSCEVGSPLISDKKREFEFRVVLAFPDEAPLDVAPLSESPLSSDQFGDMTFEEGVATFTLKGGASRTFAGLPDGTGFTVEATAADGFTVDPESYAGTIDSEGASEAAFKFTRETGDLTVSCEVVNPVAADNDQEFEFAVALDDPLVNGTYGNMVFEGRVATFTLKSGGFATATGLPKGVGYAVVAPDVDGFVLAEWIGDTGTINPEGTSEASFTFARETGDLKVEVAFGSWLSQLPSFPDGKVTVTAVDFPELSGTFGDLTFVDGSAAYDYPGDGGFGLSATGLPVGTYTVIADGFAEDGLSVDTTYSEYGGKVVVAFDETAVVEVMNTISAASPVEQCFSKLPSANSGLIFNDTSQQLISAGTLHSSLAGCRVEYAVVGSHPAEDSDSWSTILPQETGAGTYKVWYRVVDSTFNTVLGASEEPISVTIAPRSLADAEVALKYDSHAYTGEALEPDVTVTLDGDTLNGSTDYDVSYSNNTNAGTATVTITGKGNYTGTKEANFTINQKSITGATITLTPNKKTFDGAAFEPEVTVELDGFSKPLVKDTEYTVTYSNNTNAGTATVTITGTGNFEGTKTANFTIKRKSLAGAEITIDPSSVVYTGKKIKPKITSVTVDGISVPSDAYTLKVSGEKQAGETVTVALTAKSNSNFKGSSKTTFTITKAAPGTSDLKPTPSLAATYGQTLGDIKAGLAGALGSVLGVDGAALSGVWAWEQADDTLVGDVGEHIFTAVFSPDSANYSAVEVEVTVVVANDRSSWGTPYVREADGVTQYVVEDPTSPDYGMTSVELDSATGWATGAGRLFWVHESSGGSSAWYGLWLPSPLVRGPGYRFYVQWLSPGAPGYDALVAQLDDEAKQRVEDDNGWLFNMGIRDPDGNEIRDLTNRLDPSVKPLVYVQIGDDWDVADLNAYYIASGADEKVPVDYLMIDYPEGTDTFGRMTLDHFSPYFIFDELTDEEKAALELKPEDGNNQPTDKPDSSGTDSPGTGDMATQMTVAALGMVLVLALGIMLKLITSKRKFEE